MKASLGEAFGVPALKYTIVGGNFGYGAGAASTSTLPARTTYWGLGLTQGIAKTPLNLTLNYDHFENHVGGVGLIWKENRFTGGFKYQFPGPDIVPASKEPTVPLPFLVRNVMTF